VNFIKEYEDDVRSFTQVNTAYIYAHVKFKGKK